MQQVSFLPLIIHEKFPVKLKVHLKFVSSCKESNIMLFTRSKRECPLISDGTENGTVACIYDCKDSCSTKVTIGFIKPWNVSVTWSICEISPV